VQRSNPQRGQPFAVCESQQPRVFRVFAVGAIAWTGVVVVSTSGLGAWLGHGHLLRGGMPFEVVLPAFTLGWLLMVAAMMIPTLPPLPARPGGAVVGFVWIWTAFGFAALLFDAGVHWSVDHSLWLRAHAWLIQAGLLGSAGVYQFTPPKGFFLGRCLRPARTNEITDGWRCGWSSVGCCWALMLSGFAAGMSQLGWMAGLTIAMTAERHSPRPTLVAHAVGAVLLALCAAVVATSLIQPISPFAA
jgi:predicted metal-binding membrane protein